MVASRPIRRAARALCALAPALTPLAGCGEPTGAGPEARAQREWPAGTVLAVGGEPIAAEEIDRDMAVVMQVAVDSVARDLQRKALVHLTLPRAIGRALGGKRRARVLAEVEAWRAELAAGEQAGPLGLEHLSGGYGDMDLALWGAALDTPIGAWTEIQDVGGEFVFGRVLARSEHTIAAGTVVEVEAARRAYLEGPSPQAEVERAMDRLTLTIVDPLWREVVPEIIQHRMRARLPGGPAEANR